MPINGYEILPFLFLQDPSSVLKSVVDVINATYFCVCRLEVGGGCCPPNPTILSPMSLRGGEETFSLLQPELFRVGLEWNWLPVFESPEAKGCWCAFTAPFCPACEKGWKSVEHVSSASTVSLGKSPDPLYVPLFLPALWQCIGCYHCH